MQKTAALLTLLFLFHFCSAQSEWDTTYFKSAKSKLNLGLVLSERSYQIDFSGLGKNAKAPPFKYKANAPEAIGFLVDNKKISLQVLFRLKPKDDPKKGISQFSNLALSLGGRNTVFEGGYRFFKGFYDETSGNYLPGFNDSTPYYRQPTLTANYIKIKGYFFLNRNKFCYKATYSAGFRQLKSASSLVLTANFLSERLVSDSAFIPVFLTDQYPNGTNIRGVSHFGFGTGAGYSGTLVFFKRLFANLTLVPSLHLQRRSYYKTDGHPISGSYITLLLDSRFSLGYSGEKLFFILSATNDRHWNNGYGLKIQPSFVSGTFTMGYRLDIEKKKGKR